MSYYVIEDFRLGVDRRKHKLALPAGALLYGKNANINRGGEPESCKAFVAKYTLPANTFGMIAAAGSLYAFGSVVAPTMPSGVLYQRLQYIDGSAMTRLVYTTVIKGKIFAIADFVGGRGVFYDGSLAADWVAGTGGMSSFDDVAEHFAALIDADANYTVAATGPTVRVTGASGVNYTVATSATNGGVANDQYATVSQIQASSAATGETLATGTVECNGTAPGDSISALTVNGVDIIGASPTADSDDEMAQALATYINTHTSSPNYTASAAGNICTITAAPGSGATPNGFVVAATPVGSVAFTTGNMASGVTASSGAAKIVDITFGGTFEATDSFSVTLNGTVFGGGGEDDSIAGAEPVFALVHKGKTHAVAGPNLFGSEIGNAAGWQSGTGTYVTDMSSELQGAEDLTALALFQGKLAVFSRSTVQIRLVDADPANDITIQSLENIGTMAPLTVKAFGDADVFFLSDTGLRSLKVRSSTDSATLSDIGSPIDPLIIEAIAEAGDNAALAVGAIEPVDGRYFLQIGAVTYVYHFFPDAKVSGWTTYETGLSITHFASLNQRFYARAGNTIYLLGGDDNDEWSQQPMNLKLPFLSARQIGTLKHFTGIDLAIDGNLSVYLSTDPNQEDEEEKVAEMTQSTFGVGAVPINGEDTSVFSLRLLGKAGEYTRVATVVVHYEPVRQNAEAA